MNNFKNKNFTKIINSKFLYALPLVGIGLIYTHQTANAMFNPNKKPLTNQIISNTSKNTSTSPTRPTPSPIYNCLYLGNNTNASLTGTSSPSSLTSRFMNPDLSKSISSASTSDTKSTKPTSTTSPKIYTPPIGTQPIVGPDGKPRTYKMKIVTVTYIDDESSSSTSKTSRKSTLHSGLETKPKTDSQISTTPTSLKNIYPTSTLKTNPIKPTPNPIYDYLYLGKKPVNTSSTDSTSTP